MKKVFGFFAKIAKWVAIVVAVAVIVAAALQVGFGIQLLPILGDILTKLGILKLEGVGFSFAAGEGGAAVGIGLGPTGYVLGGLAGAGAVNNFLQTKRGYNKRVRALRQRIVDIAVKYVDNEAWRTDRKKGRANKGDYKCNQFVHDVLKEAGAPAPETPGGWPIQAGDWASNRPISGWELVPPDSPLKPGDVLARARRSQGATGHVAIYVGNDKTIGTGADGTILRGDWGDRLFQSRDPWPWQEKVVARRCVRAK